MLRGLDETGVAVAASVAACLALAPRAANADTRAIVAVDSYVATTPDGRATDVADVALSARLDWRSDDGARQVVADWVERESLIGDEPRRELQELGYTERGIEHLTLRAGRFRAPGGFWLIVDGAGVALRTDLVEAGVYAGSRAFTSSRTDTLLTSSPHPLPLVGASVVARGQTTQAELAYTYTYDRVDIDLGGTADGAPGAVVRSVRQPEQYVDAEVVSQLSEHVFASAGGDLGNRYLVTYPTDPTHLGDDPTLDKIYFGSQEAYALVDGTTGGLRLSATAAVLHASLAARGAGDPMAAAALAPLTGSFGEGTLRARYRPIPELRLDARYRARVRTDHSREQRGQVSGILRIGVLEASLMIGADLEHTGTTAPGFVRERSLLYRASVARKTPVTELALGAAAVAALGDEVSLTPGDDDQRAPYTLEARSYAFVDAFAHAKGYFGGVDAELDLHGEGLRILAQIGWSR